MDYSSRADKFKSIARHESQERLREYNGVLDDTISKGTTASATDLTYGTSSISHANRKCSLSDHQQEADNVIANGSTGVKSEPSLHQNADLDYNRQHPSSTDDLLPSSTSQPFGHSSSSFPGNLVIKLQGNSFSRDVHQPEVVSQLSKQLGVNVVLQMENSDGEVVLEETVTPALNNSTSTPVDTHPGEEVEQTESKLFSTEMNGDRHEPVIVSTVLNTIRELATRLGRMEQLRDCPICGDTVTGFHYGVQTCESCKGFFKRTVQNKKIFKCSRNGDCEVYLATRKKCPACRFQKCCDVGMKVEGIREDRSRGGRSTYDGASAFIHRRFKRSSESSEYQTNSTSYHTQQKRHKPNELFPPEPPLTQPEVPELLEQILQLEGLYEEVSTDPKPCCVHRMGEGDKDKFNSMLHMTEHRLYQIVKWARHLPSFLNVHTDDQVLLLQNAWAELTSLGVIWRSRNTDGLILLSYGKTIDLHKAKEMNHEEVISRMLYVCDSFRRLRIDHHEYVALKVLALMLPDIKGLKNREVVQDYQSSLLAALRTYTTSHYPDIPLKFGELLLRLSEVQRLTALSRQQMIQLQSPELEKNSLLMECLRHQSFGKGPSLTDSEALNVINSNFKHEPMPAQQSFIRSSQRTPGVAVVAPHTTRTDRPLAVPKSSSGITSQSDRAPSSYSEGAPSKRDLAKIKAITVQTHHQPTSYLGSPQTTPLPIHSPVVSKASRTITSKEDYFRPSPQHRRNSVAATDTPLQSPHEQMTASNLSGKSISRAFLSSSSSVSHVETSTYEQTASLPDQRSGRKASDTRRTSSPSDYYTQVPAHSSSIHLDSHRLSYTHSPLDCSRLNSQFMSVERLQNGIMLGSEGNEQLMSSSLACADLLATHRFASLAHNFHTNMDMPQDFSTVRSRLAHDPGGS